jgi:HPt (histidine-containing phosphotransfer) domain-containing protein
MRGFLEASLFEKIQSLGHRLKGNAKSYGFEELGWIGSKLEDAAEKHDETGIRTLITETEDYLNRVTPLYPDSLSRMPNSNIFL